MGKCKAACGKMLSGVENHHARIDWFVAVLLAFTPILQHYRAPLYNAALTAIVLMVPYLALRTLPKLKDYKASNLKFVAVMILYLVYRVIVHGTSVSELGQSGVLIAYFVAAAFGCIDLKTLCKTGLFVSLAASVILVMQYLGFYLFNTHLQMVPTGLLLPSADQWILGAQTGLAGITGKLSDFYRPSAFFLEPSHFYIYAFPHLLIQLFKGKDRKALCAAILITVGMVLCTSGMGIVAALGAWGLFFVIYDETTGKFSLRNIVRKRNMVMLAILLVAFALAFTFVPTVRRTITRIFVSKTGVNAIAGRIDRALDAVKGMTLVQWIIGVEDTTHHISYNMPGLVAALYRHGLIGMLMSISIYLNSLFKLKLPYWLVAALILVTSLFSAHTHSTVGMLYYSMILMYGYQTQRRT